MGFPDYRDTQEAGAIRSAPTIEDLAQILGLPPDTLARSVAETHEDGRDRFGRDLGATRPLEGMFYGVKVTGALFHTQGGLRIDDKARVLKKGGDIPLPNLYAGGGAACGVSGPDISGYLSGNGLLTAVALGRLAGQHAAGAV